MENGQQVLPSIVATSEEPVQETPPICSTMTFGKAQSIEDKLSMLKKLVVLGGLRKLEEERSILREQNRQMTERQANMRGNPFLKDLQMRDKQLFYGTLQPDVFRPHSIVKERLLTDITRNIRRVRRRPSIKKGTRFLSQDDCSGSKWCILQRGSDEFCNLNNANTLNTQISIAPSVRSLKKWSTKRLDGPKLYRRHIDYQSLEPCLQMFTGQNCTINYVADNPIINNATQKVLKQLVDSISEFRTRLDGRYTKLEGFISLELKLQKNINAALEEANCLIQLLYAEFVKSKMLGDSEFGTDLQRINYAYQGRPMVLDRFTIDSEKTGWQKNVNNFIKISAELLRIIDGYWILQKLNSKNFSQKDCYLIIRYSMKLQYNINLLTQQKLYFQSEDKHSKFKLVRYPTTLEIVKTEFRMRMKELRTQR